LEEGEMATEVMETGARGHTAAGFERMRETLERVVREHGEDGVSLGVYAGGEKVVDLCCGTAGGRPWAEDTLAVMFSSTKGATALCAQILEDRGLLDLDAPVTRYWPEYGQAGKERTLVRHLLSHTAGVVSFPRYWEVIGRDRLGMANWELVIDRLAASPPTWEPGSRCWYHALTYGFLVGEVIRRIDGRTPGRFFAEEVAGPLGLDFHIGASPDVIARVASILPAPAVAVADRTPEQAQGAALIERLTQRAWATLRNGGTGIEEEALLVSQNLTWPFDTTDGDQFARDFNQPAFLAAEVPAGNGVAAGRDLARMYAMLAGGGELDGVRIVSPESIERFNVPQAQWVPNTPWICMGYHRLGPDTHGASETAFGHGGAGGALGFADPQRRLGFGFVKNRMRREVPGAAAALVEAVYACL
jgi:CubicO group peptidase (beta-lactamase class C family)